MPYGPLQADLDLPGLERRCLERWGAHDLPAAVHKLRAGAEPWIFYEGPPTANGRPGIHHVWARVFKDLYPRFQTMRGHDVPRKGGWDCHGLPVEIEVEKELGLTTKQQVEEYGIDAFNQRCRESVTRYVDDWVSLTSRSGVWIDTSDAYWTMDSTYVESVWWLIKQMWDDGLLYEADRVVPHCPRCETALSSHELGQPGSYREVQDASAFVRFPLVDRDQDLLVWTTTPWTLVSNTAAAVGADIEYVALDPGDGSRPFLVSEEVADARWPELRRGELVRGSELDGLRYRRPFEWLPIGDGGQRVVTGDFVGTEEGTGIVHLAPAFGEDDADVAAAVGLPTLNPVASDGRFTDERIPFAGHTVHESDPTVLGLLEEQDLLVLTEPYEHSYPHCWRCGTKLIYWARGSWFVRTSARRDELLAANETIGWHPHTIKHGRFGKWLEGNVDWALSRDRFWGTPLPVWRCPEGHATCIGSLEELGRLAGRDLGDLDPHRPHIDEVEIGCPECGAGARRVPPVIDAWFDSGSMPSAQHHFPFGDRATFDENFPADFICEAIDQTRGWFYSLLAVNTLVFGQSPYRNVVCLNLIVDADGQKMSKSRGNVLDPWEVIERHGADAVRWYFFSASSPWNVRRVSDEAITTASRRTLDTLWNVLSFFVTYADIEGWTHTGEPPAPIHLLDRWLLSEVDDAVDVVTAALTDFDAYAAATRLATLIDDLSNWYVRRSRARFWSGHDPQAFASLHHALQVLAQLLAPFCPFVADEIHRTLTGEESVHLADWPEAAGHADPELAAQVEGLRRMVALGRSARSEGGVKVRLPLRRALLVHPGVSMSAEIEEEIRDELNVKAIETVQGLDDLMSWEVVPDFKVLGPRLGSRVQEVKALLSEADGNALHAALARDGRLTVGDFELGPDDVEVRATGHDSYALADDGAWAVALDLEVDAELEREGLARSLSRSLNELRKDAGLEISDRIELTIGGDDEIEAALDAHGDQIADDVLAVKVQRQPGEQTLDVDGHQVLVSLARVSR